MVWYCLIDEFEKKRKNISDLISDKCSSLENKAKIEGELKELKMKHKNLSQTPIGFKTEFQMLEEEMDASRRRLHQESLRIEGLGLEIKKLEKLVDEVRIINVIYVDQTNYGFINGLIDVNRDILMKLLKKIDDRKIKIIIGMAEIFYCWTKTRIFQCFVRGLRGKWSSIHKSTDVAISANGTMAIVFSNKNKPSVSSLHLVLVGDSKVRHGKAAVLVRTYSRDSNCLMLGVLSELPSTNIDYEWPQFLYALRSDEDHVSGSGHNVKLTINRGCFMSGDTVTVRVDVDAGTLAFFKNRQTEPLASLADVCIKKGVYLAGQLSGVGSRLVIVDLTYDV